MISSEVKKGKRRLRVRPLAKLPPRWAGEKQVRPCTHNPQVASPHDSVVASVIEHSKEEQLIERVHGHRLNRYVSQPNQPSSDSWTHSMAIDNTTTSTDQEIVLFINGKKFSVVNME